MFLTSEKIFFSHISFELKIFFFFKFCFNHSILIQAHLFYIEFVIIHDYLYGKHGGNEVIHSKNRLNIQSFIFFV